MEWIRDELAREFGTPFEKAKVALTTGGYRTFNGVAADGLTVASITNSSGATSGGKRPVGKIRGAVAELYFLQLVEAPRRMLVVTNPEFCVYLTDYLEGALASGLSIHQVQLPPEMQAEVANVNRTASEEMTA
jgi:hypothetical protein